MKISEVLEYLNWPKFENYSGQVVAEHAEKRDDYIVFDLTCTCSEVANGNADEVGEVLVALLNAAAAMYGMLAEQTTTDELDEQIEAAMQLRAKTIEERRKV